MNQFGGEMAVYGAVVPLGLAALLLWIRFS